MSWSHERVENTPTIDVLQVTDMQQIFSTIFAYTTSYDYDCQ